MLSKNKNLPGQETEQKQTNKIKETGSVGSLGEAARDGDPGFHLLKDNEYLYQPI